MSKFIPSMDYGRMAQFATVDVSDIFLLGLKSNTTTKEAWIGAQSQNNGLQLSDYCWMNNQISAGSQITNHSNFPVDLSTNAANSQPFCLTTNVPGGGAYGYSCSIGNKQAVICEFGKNADLYHER